jgi:hypothetical protein
LDVPEGTEISVFPSPPGLEGELGDVEGFSGSLDDGLDVEYTVFERVTVIPAPPEPDHSPLRFRSLDNHYVSGVTFHTVSHPVRRVRLPTVDPGKAERS